jgi:hypothetical protein
MMLPRLLATALLSWAVPLSLCACDQLGNPPLRHGHTEAVTWRAGDVALTTSSQTFPSEHAGDVLRALPRHRLQQTDPFPRSGATLTLVLVEVQSPRHVLPYSLRFLTAVTLPDGRVLSRTWQASGRETSFYTVVVVPQTPVAVITKFR